MVNHPPPLHRLKAAKEDTPSGLFLCSSASLNSQGRTMATSPDKSYAQSLEASLNDPAEAASYLAAVMELDDKAALLLALRHVAQARGMAEIARLI